MLALARLGPEGFCVKPSRRFSYPRQHIGRTPVNFQFLLRNDWAEVALIHGGSTRGFEEPADWSFPAQIWISGPIIWRCSRKYARLAFPLIKTPAKASVLESPVSLLLTWKTGAPLRPAALMSTGEQSGPPSGVQH